MNKLICFIFLFYIFLPNGITQIENQIDSLAHLFCNDFEYDKSVNLDLKFDILLKKHFLTYIQKVEAEDQESVSKLIMIRLQQNCDEIAKYLYEKDPGVGDWVMLDKQMKSKITKKQHKEFFKKNTHVYIEPNGDEVVVNLSKKMWIDNFEDGTYSKLKVKIIEIGKFEIEFLESNNEIRNKLSIKGEKYIYTIISKELDFFYVTVESPKSDQIFLFKMY